MTSKRLLSLLILFVLIFGAGWIWLNRIPDAAASRSESIPLKGHPAPDFRLPTLSGETLSLSELQGQPVVLNFWATWCPPCQAEMPELQATYEEFSSGGLVVLGVNQAEDAATVRAFLEERSLTFPVVLDPEYEASQSYQINSIPTTFFIDRKGVIQEIVIGQMNAALLKQKLHSIYP